jgi:uroporphyrin-III C-methyltransferase
VGAGPGDPSLITVRGLRLLRACDVLVHDRLVSRELLNEAPPSALRIAREALDQSEVNELLVAYGREGLRVVRLKGGDPFVFGRGGEEALALAEAGVPYEVVPGVSSLAAVPASAGIPITHRGLASQATIVAGHAPEDLDYEALAHSGTLVLFMGLRALPRIAAGLLEAGMDPGTPSAVIASGTLEHKTVLTATLDEIAEAAAGAEPPALVVIGEVVALGERLRDPRGTALATPARIPPHPAPAR